MAEKTTNQAESKGEAIQSETPVTWDAWIGNQAEEVRNLYNAHITGLQNTVKATRSEQDKLRAQINALTAQAERGSEMEKSLADLGQKLEQTERRAVFAEGAIKPEIGCRNIRGAYAIAQADDLWTRSGQPDWDAIRKAAPEFFGKPPVSGNAGSGTDQPPAALDINAAIRRAAGR